MIQPTTLEMVVKAVDNASGTLGKIQANVTHVGESLDKSVGTIKNLAAGGLIIAALKEGYEVLKKFAEPSIEAQKSLVELTGAVERAGVALGVTVPQIQDLAGEIQNASAFSDEAVQDAATNLTLFTKVTGDTFTRALKVSADLAARMGVDVPQAAHTLGRALQDPGEGLRVLLQAGVRFNEEQIKTLKYMADTGHLAEAQTIILDELGKRTGGAAAEGVKTFGGAMKQLGNQLGELFEVPEAIDKISESISKLATRISELRASKAGQVTKEILKGVYEAGKFIIAPGLAARDLYDRLTAKPKAAEAVQGAAATGELPPPAKDPLAEATKRRLAEQDLMRSFGVITDAYAKQNAEIDQAQNLRLIADTEYYAKKRELIEKNAANDVKAVQAENARLAVLIKAGTEVGTNQEKQKDNAAKIAHIRSEASIKLIALATEEQSANREIALSYDKARLSAQQYLETLRLGYSVDVSGQSQGNKEREFHAGLRQLTDAARTARDEQSQKLLADPVNYRAQYDRQLALIDDTLSKATAQYRAYWAVREAGEEEASNGAMRAQANYLDNAKNVAQQMEDMYTKAFGGIEDALVNFVTSGKLSFRSLATSIIADIARMEVKAAASKLFGGGGGSGALGGFFSGLAAAFFGGSAGGKASFGAGDKTLLGGNAGGGVASGPRVVGQVVAGHVRQRPHALLQRGFVGKEAR